MLYHQFKPIAYKLENSYLAFSNLLLLFFTLDFCI